MSDQTPQYKMPSQREIDAVIIEAKRLQAESLAAMIVSALHFVRKLPTYLHINHPRLPA